jgi:hypothetical protein
MNDMRGIESWRRQNLVRVVSPLQGLKGLILEFYLGLRASRFTPGFHMAGLQPLLM